MSQVHTHMSLSHVEIVRLEKKLGEVLDGKRTSHVIIRNTDYQGLLSIIFTRVVEWEMTWHEAIRLYAYLDWYLRKEKDNGLEINTRLVKEMPLYRACK